jgi:hypothetical protein
MKMEAEPASEKSYCFKNLVDGQDPKEEDFCTNNIGRKLIYVLCSVLYKLQSIYKHISQLYSVLCDKYITKNTQT